MVSVCFLIALLTASYPLATAFLGVHPLSHIDTISNLHQTFETETTSQILEETATRLFHVLLLFHKTLPSFLLNVRYEMSKMRELYIYS